MDTFNFKRFVKTFKWYLKMKSGALLKWLGIAALGTLLIEVLMIVTTGILYPIAVKTAFNICMFAFFIAFSVALSNIFADLRSKARRTSFLMLPAANSEKYLTAFLYCSLIWPIATFVAFAVGDTVRMLMGALVWRYDMISSVYDWLVRLNDSKITSSAFTLGEIAGWTSLIWGHSLYVACGTWFKKVPYIIATAIGFAIFFAVAYFIHRYLFDKQTMLVNFNDTFKYVMITFFVVSAIVNYCSSYIKFKKFNVVSGNWLN